MHESRVQASKILYQECLNKNIKIKTFISASAMGYYGFNQNGIKKETDEPGNDWMSDLCVDWEKKADNFKSIGARVIKLRFSLILDKKSGLLNKTCLSFMLGIGVKFAAGTQQLPWIHIHDASKFILYALKTKSIKGVFNVASPHKISYYEFIKTIQKIKYPKSILIKMPIVLIKLIFPQKKVLLLNNISLSIEKMKKSKFKWEFPTIEHAIKQELS